MGVYHADAIVIRSRQFGESDNILTLFSREVGKINAVAKGVRKPKSRQRGGAQLFTYGQYLIHKGRNLHTINQASPKESFSHLWTDLDKTMAATASAELLDLATIPGQPHPELFTLTFSAFFLLAEEEPALVQCAYALKLMTYLGYRPLFKECTECGAKVQGERLLFSPELGGVVCGQCQLQRKSPIQGQRISGGSLGLMNQLLQGDLKKLGRIRWNQWMKNEILDTIQKYCEITLDKRLKSWRMGSRLVNVGQNPGGKDEQDNEPREVDGT